MFYIYLVYILKLQQSVILLLQDLTACLGLSIVGFTLRKEMALAYLIREIRLCGGLIDGFSMEELDYTAFFVCDIFFCWFHYMYYTLCLLWHVIHDNNNNSLMTDADLTTKHSPN